MLKHAGLPDRDKIRGNDVHVISLFTGRVTTPDAVLGEFPSCKSANRSSQSNATGAAQYGIDPHSIRSVLLMKRGDGHSGFKLSL